MLELFCYEELPVMAATRFYLEMLNISTSPNIDFILQKIQKMNILMGIKMKKNYQNLNY